MNIATRLKQRRTEQNLSQAELAQRAEVSQGLIGQLETGRNQDSKHLPKIAKALGLTYEWLATGQGEMLPQPTFRAPNRTHRYTPAEAMDANVQPLQAPAVPVISWVQAGMWCDAQPVDEVTEWLPCPVKHGPLTYALRVVGTSMHNPRGDVSFAEGDTIFVDPDKHPIHKSFVIATQDIDHQVTFKQLLIEGDTRMLQALNPDWPNRIIPINGTWRVCGVVIAQLKTL